MLKYDRFDLPKEESVVKRPIDDVMRTSHRMGERA